MTSNNRRFMMTPVKRRGYKQGYRRGRYGN
jgi:hypothetical protein